MKLLASVLLGLSYGQLFNWGNRGARPSPGVADDKDAIVDKTNFGDDVDSSSVGHKTDYQNGYDKDNDSKHMSSPIAKDSDEEYSEKHSPSIDEDDEFNQFYDKFVNHLHGYIYKNDDIEEDDKKENKGGKEKWEEEGMDQWVKDKDDRMMAEMKKGCKDCNQNVNNNYAPVNTNIQNFVDIETNINTNYNFNMGNTVSKPDKSWWPKKEWDFPLKEEWEEDPEKCIREVKEFIEAEFGFEVSDEMLSMVGDKDQFKNLVLNFFKMLQEDDESMKDDHLDAEECIVNDKGCQDWSSCRNVNGMATCVCDYGLDLDEKTCISHQGSGDQATDQPSA